MQKNHTPPPPIPSVPRSTCDVGRRTWSTDRNGLLFSLGIFVFGVVAGMGGWWFAGGERGGAPAGAPVAAIVPLSEGALTSLSETTTRYENEQFEFTIEYPSEMEVAQFDEGLGATTVVFQQPFRSERGFQLFITPHEGATISPAEIRSILPSANLDTAVEVVIGSGIRALHFSSETAVLGDTTEVWFIHRGNLYQVTARASFDAALAQIFSTISFKNK